MGSESAKKTLPAARPISDVRRLFWSYGTSVSWTKRRLFSSSCSWYQPMANWWFGLVVWDDKGAPSVTLPFIVIGASQQSKPPSQTNTWPLADAHDSQRDLVFLYLHFKVVFWNCYIYVSKAPPKRTWTVPRALGPGCPPPPCGMRCARRSGEGRRNGSVVQPCWKWRRRDLWREGLLIRTLEIICLYFLFSWHFCGYSSFNWSYKWGWKLVAWKEARKSLAKCTFSPSLPRSGNGRFGFFQTTPLPLPDPCRSATHRNAIGGDSHAREGGEA